MGIWFYLQEMPSTSYPLLCTQTEIICLTIISNGTATATYGDYQLYHNVAVTPPGWTNIIYRYNAEGKCKF